MKTPVIQLLKRVRDITDMDGDQYVEDIVLLRWLNVANHRLTAMIARAGWPVDYVVDQVEVENDDISGGMTLEQTAMAILGVYEIISDTQIRALRATTIEERPFAISNGQSALYYSVTSSDGETVVNFRPLPTTGIYTVVYIPVPKKLIIPNLGVATSPAVVTVDAGLGTFTRATGSYLDDGLQEGQIITWASFANSGNNDTFEIAALEDDVMTVVSGTLADEVGSGDEVATVGSSDQTNYTTYPNGWEEWLVLETARQVTGREESVNSNIEQRKLEVEREIERAAGDRLWAQGPKVRDVRGTETDDWTITGALMDPSNWLWC